MPQYNNSESTAALLLELKLSTYETVADKLSSFCHLLFISPYSDLATFVAQASINSLLSHDRSCAISSINNINQSSFTLDSNTIIYKFPLQHEHSPTCLLPINDENIAVAAMDGSIKLYNRKLNKPIATLKGYHQGGVSTLTSIKLFPTQLQGESNVLKKLLTQSQEKVFTYLISGGMIDRQIIIWDLQNYQAIKIFQGHSDQITSIINIRDNQHIASGSKDSSWCLWDVTAKNNPRVKRYTDHTLSVNVILLSKNKAYLYTASSDKTINVYSNTFQFCIQKQNRYLQSTVLLHKLLDSAPVYSLSVSFLNPLIIYSAGQDCKIKIWNVTNQIIEKEIVGHKSPIRSMILFENPFKVNQDNNNFLIISQGQSEEYLRISSCNSPINNSIMINHKLIFDQDNFTGPIMALIQDSACNEMSLVVLNQSIQNQHLIMFKLNQ